MTRRRPQNGFALIEIILAISILGFISVTVWATFSRTYDAKVRLQAAQERIHTVRVALMRMTRELEMAYLSSHEDSLVQQRRTLFMGQSSGGIDELRFSWFGKQRMRADAAESDTAVVIYYGQEDLETAGVVNLMRRETRRLQALDAMSVRGEAHILCPNVVGLQFRYYDGRLKEWRDKWNSMGADGVDYLPTHVRIVLTVLDERGREVTYSSSARTHMSEKVQHMPRVR